MEDSSPSPFHTSFPLTRRHFLLGSMLSSALAMIPSRAWALGEDHVKRTMLAFANCIIPGVDQDPDGAGGAIEAGVWELYTDPKYKIKPLLGTLTFGLDVMSTMMNGSRFANASFEQQKRVVSWKLDHEGPFKYFDIATYGYLMLLAKVAFFGGVVNAVGTAYVGFPMSARPQRDYSHRQKLANEMSSNGNLP